MAPVKTIDFEAGTHGNNLTTGTTGYANVTNTVPKFDNGWAKDGVLSAKATTTAGTSTCRIDLSPNLASAWPRKYEKLTNLPSANTAFWQVWVGAGTSLAAEVQITTTGTIRLRAGSGGTTTQQTSSHAFSAGDEFRAEWNPNAVAAGGTVTVRLFWGANIDGTTADETLTGTITVAGSFGQIREGTLNSATFTHAWDSVIVDDATWPGSDVPGTPTPPGFEVYIWDSSLLSGAGDYVIAAGAGLTCVYDWVSASTDYFPATGADEVHVWDGNQYLPVNVVIPPSDGRFPGDPGQGRCYFEVVRDNTRSGDYAAQFTTITNRMSAYTPATARTFGLHRIYSGPDTLLPSAEVTWALNNNLLPWVSWKGDPTAITSGSLDSDLAANVAMMNTAAAQGKAVWWSYYHEPEDNFTTSTAATQFRAAYRYCYDYIAAHGSGNTASAGPIYISDVTWGTFAPSSGKDWRWWWPDWKNQSTNSGGYTGTKDDPNPVDFYGKGDPNSVIDIIGLDQYMQSWTFGLALSAYDPNWFAGYMAFIDQRMQQAMGGQLPYAIGEVGWRVKQTGYYDSGTSGKTAVGWHTGTVYDADTQTMMDNLLPTIVQYDVIGWSYWNQTLNPDWYRDNRLLDHDPNLIRDKHIATELLSSSVAKHPPTTWTP